MIEIDDSLRGHKDYEKILWYAGQLLHNGEKLNKVHIFKAFGRYRTKYVVIDKSTFKRELLRSFMPIEDIVTEYTIMKFNKKLDDLVNDDDDVC